MWVAQFKHGKLYSKWESLAFGIKESLAFGIKHGKLYPH
jgi:hypothetical protein